MRLIDALLDELKKTGRYFQAKFDIENAPTVKIPNYGGQVVPNTLQGWRYEERPQGEWIKNDGRDLRDCFYTCSKCGRNINVICGETLTDYPFCHCGADMRGDNNV